MVETSRALAGKRVVLTRSEDQCQELSRLIRARGAVPVILPLIEFAPPEDSRGLETALDEFYRFDWILFTSGQAVRALAQKLAERGEPVTGRKQLEIRCAAVGPGTAEVAKLSGFPVHFVAEIHNGLALAKELGSRIRNCRVLLPRSDRANPELPAALTREGAMVSEVVAYRTVKPRNFDQGALTFILSGQADALLFYSPSAVQHFAGLVGRSRFQMLQETLAITAVGPVTAEALRKTGVERFAVAADTTNNAVIEALEIHFSVPVSPAPAGGKRA